MPPPLSLPSLLLAPHCKGKSSGHELNLNFITSLGAYSRLIVWFQFERSIGFFLIQTYIPAYLIVMLSWIAFWISHNSTPGQWIKSQVLKKLHPIIILIILSFSLIIVFAL